MSELENTNITQGTTPPPARREMALDDARRIKTLSPGMLVFKRFIRNKLAVIGLIILVVMFTFAFIGPFLSPYSQTEVFYKQDSIRKDYASAIFNSELRYSVNDGATFSETDRARFLLANSRNEDQFASGDTHYSIERISDSFIRIFQLEKYAEELLGKVTTVDGKTVDPAFKDAFDAAVKAGQTSFVHKGVSYQLTKVLKSTVISTEKDIAMAGLSVFDAYDPAHDAIINTYGFKVAAEMAAINDEKSFVHDGIEYQIVEDEGKVTIFDAEGEPFAEVSNIIVNPIDQGTFLSVDFKSKVRDAISDRVDKFKFPGTDGKESDYHVARVNTQYFIKADTTTTVIDIYSPPTAKHWMGTDNNGMDLLTRLMYGGRVSLMVGFIVVFLEMFIGVIVGGISGFFGGAVDTALMRFVDLFNSIPYFPMILIFGSVMDTLEVKPMIRIFILMAILGLLGWTGIARVVRGQILSLREQDFMVATEATGIRTSRRIFRHLVPNVMPLLIVTATASLGGLIITEATLGFLGLGVKYPLASWGSIINISSDAFVMQTYWWMWIPAGMLILLTVLGFNFVGDGLRDAYDPKMKR